VRRGERDRDARERAGRRLRDREEHRVDSCAVVRAIAADVERRHERRHGGTFQPCANAIGYFSMNVCTRSAEGCESVRQ
jgi:hypothetical protein